MATVTCRIPAATLGQDTTVEMVLPPPGGGEEPAGMDDHL